MKRCAAWGLILLLTGCISVKVPLNQASAPVEEKVVGGSGRAKIAVVDLSGMLTMHPIGWGKLGKEPATVPRLTEELETAAADPRVVGVVVRVDSAGGSVTASDILYHEISRVRQKGLPVVACILDKGFSGGYYASLAADEIMAHPTSVLGGIGVIAFKFDLSGLLENLGVQNESVKSGPWKDFWSPLRNSKPEERALMQEITDTLHQRFLGLVAQHRELSPQALETAAKGGIFVAGEALELGLIDRIGYLEDAVARVRERAGVEEARVVIYRRPGAYAGNIYAGGFPGGLGASLAAGMDSEWLEPSFRYQLLP